MTLVACPTCRGKVYVLHTARIADPVCPTCGGAKIIDPDMMCECGRPAVRPVADTFVCMEDACYDAALAPLSDDQKRAAKEAEDWYRHYTH
jgi:uncharacterized protein YbaR (Trm112 family)